MGVRFLNKYLKNNCHHAINEKNFSYFSNKIIAVDASIYIYKYLKTNNLLEGIYSMIIAFKKHNIKPIFVFDGKSIEQKNDLILDRKEKKEKARKEYNKLLEQYNYLTNSYTHNENIDIDILVEKMNILKKECIQLKKEDVTNIKELLKEFQIQYLDAENEADTLCVQLVKNNIAYACLSEDMDMFVYGCPRVLRYISVTHEKMVLYDFKKILTILKMNEEIFQIICILSVTDYNDYVDNHVSRQCIHKVFYYMESYKLYKKQLYPHSHHPHSHPKKIIINDFENWLFNLPPKTILNTNDNCDLYDRTNYQTIKDIFQMKDIEFKFHKHTFYPSNKKINKKNIEHIMKKENFFFII